MRVIMSFMVSKFDYVASGFPMEGLWLKKRQVTLNSVFCGAFGLSDSSSVPLLAPGKRRTRMSLVDDPGGCALPDKRHEAGVRQEWAGEGSG